jgi:hypothetical protein
MCGALGRTRLILVLAKSTRPRQQTISAVSHLQMAIVLHKARAEEVTMYIGVGAVILIVLLLILFF